MRLRIVLILAALGSTVPSLAQAEEPVEPRQTPVSNDAGESRPGLLNETAALPGLDHGYVDAAGGVLPNDTGRSEGAFDARALLKIASRFAVGIGAASLPASDAPRAFTPSLTGYAQLLSQRSEGLDLTTSVRLRTLGPELAGSELSVRLNAGRAFGPAYLAVNGALGQAMGTRTDTDFDAGALGFVRVWRFLRAGGEVRVSGEVADRYPTIEDVGRPVEVLSGGVVGADFDRLLVQTLVGWSWPRGPFVAGPAALVSGTVTF